MVKKSLFFLLINGMLVTACSAPSGTSTNPPNPTNLPNSSAKWQALDYAPAPADNPLKGLMPFYNAYGSADTPIANDFPHSMEYFYVPLRDLMNGPDIFTFDTGLEPQLDSISGRGHQAVLRVYMDYPGRYTGIPQFLLDGGLKVRHYTYFGNLPNASVCPDYDDPKLLNALESFIAALGKRYDGDPRIGFIEVGLIGFWGEWHTWPQDGFTREDSVLKAQPDPKEENWMPSDANQMRILKDYDAAFNTTRLLVRYPMGMPTKGADAAPGYRVPYQSVALNIGYHDDSYAYETLFGKDWYFMGKMEWRGAADKWKTEPIGGELRPEIQLSVWSNPIPKQAEDFSMAVDATHVSWLIAHSIFTSRSMTSTAAPYQQALAGARRMGYEFYISAVELPDVGGSEPLRVSIRLENRGVAPFYYDWPVELGVVDTSGQSVATWKTDWKITGLLPTAAGITPYTELSFTQSAPGLAKGEYKLVMHVVNPLKNGKELKFANATQDQDLAGWLTLGEFAVR